MNSDILWEKLEDVKAMSKTYASISPTLGKVLTPSPCVAIHTPTYHYCPYTTTLRSSPTNQPCRNKS